MNCGKVAQKEECTLLNPGIPRVMKSSESYTSYTEDRYVTFK